VVRDDRPDGQAHDSTQNVVPTVSRHIQGGRSAPTISVVIAAYNVEKWVVETLKSVLAQTKQAHEIIVIDDGSTDGTVRELEPFTSHVRVLSQSNQGVSAALTEDSMKQPVTTSPSVAPMISGFLTNFAGKRTHSHVIHTSTSLSVTLGCSASSKASSCDRPEGAS
jgi:cellulose synthase/poly-beta-1,6-N-acetylglucosamine synthase-like glycosyltransferase